METDTRGVPRPLGSPGTAMSEDQPARSQMTAGRHLKTYRSLVIDALDHARNVAARSGEALEGTQNIFLFDAVRKAIAEFIVEHPAMKALGHAAVRDML